MNSHIVIAKTKKDALLNTIPKTDYVLSIKKPKNCPELKTGNMDEYIAKPSDMIRFVRNCFSSKVRHEGDVVSFVHKKIEYYYYHTHDYDNHYGKIYKIKKKNGDLIEFKEN